jgi:branched-chain amino acid transport system permease protein
VDILFFAKVLIGGLLSGVMYSLVALGFVLIYKASGVFNFAQGSMVLFAAMTFAGLIEVLGSHHPGDPKFWLAIAITAAVMVLLALATERFVLRRLVNQPLIILLLATLGIASIIEGGAQAVWGATVRKINIGIAERPIDLHSIFDFAAAKPSQTVAPAATMPGQSTPAEVAAPTQPPVASSTDGGADANATEEFKIESVDMPPPPPRSGLIVSQFDLIAAAIAGALVFFLATFFNRTRTGRALRAVADDNQAALSVGISLQFVWSFVWATSGIVALVAGLLWGARIGGQFLLTFVALKALPVLIIGGFTSIPGAIVGGLIVGAVEKLAEVYFGAIIGGGIESWISYVLATVFLLFRPQGLFGEKFIARV